MRSNARAALRDDTIPEILDDIRKQQHALSRHALLHGHLVVLFAKAGAADFTRWSF